MQLLLFLLGAALGYWSAQLGASVTMALALNAVPVTGFVLASAFC